MKKLKLFLALVAFCAPFATFGQTTSTVLESSEEEETSRVKVMVIPFHPIRYYFSDCDKALAKKSKLQVEDVRKSFRAGLDYASEAKMEKKYDPINLYQMKDSISVDLLDRFYENVAYTYDAPTRAVPKEKNNIFKKLQRKIGRNDKEKVSNRIPEEESYTTLEGDDGQYMKASFNKPEFFEEMKAKYPADYYVTINQFEVKTDYEKCIDRELGRFDRRIKVHFNVFNENGQMIWGDVVTAKYNSTSDNINEIIQDNFGFLGEYITNAVPKRM